MARLSTALLAAAALTSAACASDPHHAPNHGPLRFRIARTIAECRGLLPQRPALCAAADFASGQVEIAHVDVNQDGADDLVLRRQSSLTCGSHGCATDIYLKGRAGYVHGDPPLVTVGPIHRCRTSAGAGLQMTLDQGRGPCIIVK